MTISECLKDNRELCEMTQAQVAEAIGVHKNSIVNWETGRAKPKIDSIIKLATVFGVTVDDLLRCE